ncbi:hypothetical protein E2562_036606 [Oryza meyeriana var. granulata]|uniref:Uncharacterized protein n=1 Tax=Oryza meyeriana var. granulata TaxID=110450 RepID=A0A6G1DB31_9ORYZ|nr:hypothetical protein E2562_036606 [Oryza meyeriana var. granulata]
MASPSVAAASLGDRRRRGAYLSPTASLLVIALYKAKAEHEEEKGKANSPTANEVDANGV